MTGIGRVAEPNTGVLNCAASLDLLTLTQLVIVTRLVFLFEVQRVYAQRSHKYRHVRKCAPL